MSIRGYFIHTRTRILYYEANLWEVRVFSLPTAPTGQLTTNACSQLQQRLYSRRVELARHFHHANRGMAIASSTGAILESRRVFNRF